MIHFIRCFGAVVVLFVSASLSKADLVQFNVVLNGSQEVPSNGSPGTGTAVVVFDNVSGAMSITGSYSGLVANVNNAHLHGYAPAGVNAGVIFGLTHTGGTSGTITGNGVIPGANIANVMNGLTYINVHSDTFPGGEIRGQLINPVPEPSAFLLGTLAGLAVLRRRRH